MNQSRKLCGWQFFPWPKRMTTHRNDLCVCPSRRFPFFVGVLVTWKSEFSTTDGISFEIPHTFARSCMFDFRNIWNRTSGRRQQERNRRKTAKKLARRRLLLESLEERRVMDAAPTKITINPSGFSNPSRFRGRRKRRVFHRERWNPRHRVVEDGRNGRRARPWWRTSIPVLADRARPI